MRETKEKNTNAPVRRLPRIPALKQRVPVLINTDAGCENDDQFAIALALALPARFEIKGFVATFFRGSPDSIPEAVAEITLVQKLCGCSYPVVPGGAPLSYAGVGNHSAGADFIIETARAHSPENPLWVVVLGPTTNTASALLQCPEIAEKIAVLFHGRTQFWPRQAWNNNVDADLRATQALFRSRAPLVLFDTGSYLRIDNAITRERLAVRGPIGAYLQDTRESKPYRQTLRKSFFDLGDIAWLADPSVGFMEKVEIPELGNDTLLDWRHTHGEGLRVFQLDDARVWELLFSAMAERYPEPAPYVPRPERVNLYPETARARTAAKALAEGPLPGRRLPVLPEAGRRIPVLMDTNAGREIEDAFAIAMSLCWPERFDLKGIVGGRFNGQPESRDVCVKQVRELMTLSGCPDLCPVVRGCDPLSWPDRPMAGEAVDLIIEKVLERSPDDPLWIVALGPLSNVASACLKRPEIAERMVVLFHSESRHWDLKFHSDNALQDAHAARVVMRSPLPLILFDAGSHLTVSAQEIGARLAPAGRLGVCLHECWRLNADGARAGRDVGGLGSMVWLGDPLLGEWQEVDVPELGSDAGLDFSRPHGRCLRVYQIDNRRARELFFEKITGRSPGENTWKP